MAQVLSSPAPTPRRSSRTTAGAVAQGPDPDAACPGGAKQKDIEVTSAKVAVNEDESSLQLSNNDGLKHSIEENAAIKYSALYSHTGDAKKDMVQFKIKKVFTKYDKIRSDRVEKAAADFARELQNINAEYTLDLMAALSEAISAPEVAIVYHEKMLDHFPPEGCNPVEKPERLSTIMDTLRKLKIIDRCQVFDAPRANSENLLLVHGSKHVNFVDTLSSKMTDGTVASLSESDEDMYFSSGSTGAIMFAAGGAMLACDLVLTGPFSYSFAIVRPPGHHVGKDGPESGFCYVNNVALAAKHSLKYHGKKRILILDIDIHHGDGSQDIFYKDKNVLFISVHRFDKNEFFPKNDAGHLGCTGDGNAVGYNMNVCWHHGGIRDADYLAVWEHIVLPVVNEFDPELIFISAGFDGAKNDPLGGCKVTPNCFAHLVQQLMEYPIVMVLEGGYDLPALADSVAACIKALLGDRCSKLDNRIQPFTTTWSMIKETREKFRPFWRCFENEIPERVTSKGKQYCPKAA